MLKATNLGCVRGDRRLFSELNFSLQPGQLVQLTGPNGSGKTSLLRIICGLLAPAEGEIRWQGGNIRSLGEEYFRSITYIGHRNGVKDELTAMENLRVSSGLGGVEVNRIQAADVLEKMGLAGRETLPARLLSEGQRRRVALARLMVRNTTLWLLDEVLSSLDTAAVTLVKLSEPSTLSMLGWVVWRDLILAWRRRADVLSTLFFFVIVVSLFPLGIGPETQLLRSIAPGVVWVAALLASMLSLGRLFASDLQDGTLEQMLLTPQPLYLIVLGKVFAQWLVSEVPLVLIAPLLGVQFGLSQDTLLVLFASLLIGTPILSLIGSIGAALTLGLRGGGVLISLLVLPLYIPVLIFGAGAVDASIAGTSPLANVELLTAFLVVTLVFAPWATSAGLRISLE